ncbi:hypothetical protein M3J09_004641 [Ascochyta lentis]
MAQRCLMKAWRNLFETRLCREWELVLAVIHSRTTLGLRRLANSAEALSPVSMALPSLAKARDL